MTATMPLHIREYTSFVFESNRGLLANSFIRRNSLVSRSLFASCLVGVLLSLSLSNLRQFSNSKCSSNSCCTSQRLEIDVSQPIGQYRWSKATLHQSQQTNLSQGR